MANQNIAVFNDGLRPVLPEYTEGRMDRKALFAKPPINFLPAMAQLGSPIIITFCLFPSAVIAHQYGIKKGLLVFVGTVLVRQIIAYYGVISFGASTVRLNPDGMALLAAVILMLAFAMKEKAEGPGANAALVGLFSARIASIKKHILILAVMGGLLAAAVSFGVLAGDPVSLNLLA